MISILMPVRNAESWLAECIASIQGQQLTRWELLAVDDYSTDNSEPILTRMARADQRIKVFTNDGRGIVDALKTAYTQSSGEFIHRMDADDLMPPGKLEILKTALEGSQSGCVATGKVRYFTNRPTPVSAGYLQYQQWLNQRALTGDHWRQVYRECVVASPNWLIRRPDFNTAGTMKNISYPEDYDMVFQWYRAGYDIASAREVTHWWREHEDRTSRTSAHYSQRAFFQLKLQRFIQIDREWEKPLIIFGKGKKAQLTRSILRTAGEEFITIKPSPSASETREGALSQHRLSTFLPAQILCAAAPHMRGGVQAANFLQELNLSEGVDYWFL